jgi:hypothetical protein
MFEAERKPPSDTWKSNFFRCIFTAMLVIKKHGITDIFIGSPPKQGMDVLKKVSINVTHSEGE